MEGRRSPDPGGEGEAPARGTALPDRGTLLAGAPREQPPSSSPPLPQPAPQPIRVAQRALRGRRRPQGVPEHQERTVVE